MTFSLSRVGAVATPHPENLEQGWVSLVTVEEGRPSSVWVTHCGEVSGGLSSTADTGTVRAGGGKDVLFGTGGGEGMFVHSA